MVVTFDVEAQIDHLDDVKGNPFHGKNELVSLAVKSDSDDTTFHYYSDIDFPTRLRESLESVTLVVGFNVKYDLHIVRRHLGLYPPNGCRIWDCQLAEFIISGQKAVMPSLNEAAARFGLGAKDDKVAEYWKLGVSTKDIPVDELRVYNIRDVDLTYELYLKQRAAMTPKQERLCLVQGLDLLVLAEMEWNGIKFDIDLCVEKANETAARLGEITTELRALFGIPDIVNLDSGHQLSCLLYGGSFEIPVVDHVEDRIVQSGPNKGKPYQRNVWRTDRFDRLRLFVPLRGSETRLVSKVSGGEEYPVYQTGEDVLKQLRTRDRTSKRIIELLLERAELAKLLDTYYGKMPKILEQYEWGDTLHGQYNQCVAATGRLSSSNPNMQNFAGEADKLLVSRYDS